MVLPASWAIAASVSPRARRPWRRPRRPGSGAGPPSPAPTSRAGRRGRRPPPGRPGRGRPARSGRGSRRGGRGRRRSPCQPVTTASPATTGGDLPPSGRGPACRERRRSTPGWRRRDQSVSGSLAKGASRVERRDARSPGPGCGGAGRRSRCGRPPRPGSGRARPATPASPARGRTASAGSCRARCSRRGGGSGRRWPTRSRPGGPPARTAAGRRRRRRAGQRLRVGHPLEHLDLDATGRAVTADGVTASQRPGHVEQVVAGHPDPHGAGVARVEGDVEQALVVGVDLGLGGVRRLRPAVAARPPPSPWPGWPPSPAGP